MIRMLAQMAGVTSLYVLVTVLIWRITHKKRLTRLQQIGIGLVYGACSVLSTHFGVDYGHMLLNVRDMGPLAAGLFFHPLSGVLSGLIGGIERYVAGRYWGIGSFTRVACGLSTCLAGFVAVFMNRLIFGGRKPSPIYAFCMGTVMEIFHMYVIFITHRDDMQMAFYVVRNCSGPMILFTGLGLAASSVCLQMCAGEWRNPLRVKNREEIPVSTRFLRWLFAVLLVAFAVNFAVSYILQTQTALQDAARLLGQSGTDIADIYKRARSTQMKADAQAESQALSDARAVARAADSRGSQDTIDETFLENMRQVYGFESVALCSQAGARLAQAKRDGSAPDVPDGSVFTAVLGGIAQEQLLRLPDNLFAAGVACEKGMIVAVTGMGRLISQVTVDLDGALAAYHVGETGAFDLVLEDGRVLAGTHKGAVLAAEPLEQTRRAQGPAFSAEPFGTPAICRAQRLAKGLYLLTMIPKAEVYLNRNIQMHEEAFEDILLFTVVYVLITLLVQHIVVRNLHLVNASLGRITRGNLNEVVAVRDSSEFATLSRDINLTVTALKGYIEAAEKRIEQELEFARVIQDSALPKNFGLQEDCEIFALMNPAKEVGGDFYDFFPAGPGRMALVIADVSGKGIPAALFMMRSKTAIRSRAESGDSPSEILRRVNNELCEGNDAEMFVSVWIGILDIASGVMRCANAGHEYPALMRADGEWELIRDRHSLVLAAMEGMRTPEYELRLNPGDKLFVYTDGVPEAIDAAEQQYGTDRMLNALNAARARPMSEVLPAVRRDIRNFVGDADPFDDITMLGLCYKSGAARGQSGDEGGENT